MTSSASSRAAYTFPAGIKVFTSTDHGYSVVEFLSSVHANVRALAVPPQGLHISNYLRGRALLWFATWHSNDSYDELRSALLQTFAFDWSAEFSPKRELRLLQQGFGTVDQYAAEFEHLAANSGENVNAEYNLRWFAWGLRKEVAELVFSEPYAFRSFDHLVGVAEDAAVYLHLERRVPRSPLREGAATRLRRRYAESLRKAKAFFFVLRRSPDPSVLAAQAETASVLSLASVSELGFEKTPTPSPRKPPSTRGRLRSFTSHPEIVSDFEMLNTRRAIPDVPADASPGGFNRSTGSPTATRRTRLST